MKTHCKHGHELCPDNVYIHPSGYSVCRRCKNAAKVRYVSKGVGREKHKASIRNCHYKKRYGVTTERRDEMCAEQENRCAICKRIFEATPFIDHDHETKVVRELLCRFCNTGLGMFGDNLEILSQAVEYLRKWKEKK